MVSRVIIAVWLSWLLIHDVHIECQYGSQYMMYDGERAFKVGVCK